jgi:5-methylcytosine-specific restriction endonuclease McrA
MLPLPEAGDRKVGQVDYRERALKLFPWICARCGREFAGRNLRELTVHHKDHDHDNNPPDGSNWELLCLYCHDEEHTKYVGTAPDRGRKRVAPATHKPFAGLDALFDDKSRS